MDFDIAQFAFLYGDCEYFDWFQRRTERTLLAVLKWKQLHRDPAGPTSCIGRIWDGRKLVVAAFDDFALVTRAFLHHLEKPLEFPILDRYVWAAMRHLRGESSALLVKEPTDWQRHYCACYVPFFNELYAEYAGAFAPPPRIDGVDTEVVRRRVLDRALWTLGRAQGDS